MEFKLFFGLSRLNRTRYILYSFILGVFPVIFLLWYLFILIDLAYYGFQTLVLSTSLLLTLFIVSYLFLFKITIQRFRDINCRVWWAVIFFSPAFLFVFLILSSMSGDNYGNRYGNPSLKTHKVYSVLAALIYILFLFVGFLYIGLSMFSVFG